RSLPHCDPNIALTRKEPPERRVPAPVHPPRSSVGSAGEVLRKSVVSQLGALAPGTSPELESLGLSGAKWMYSRNRRSGFPAGVFVMNEHRPPARGYNQNIGAWITSRRRGNQPAAFIRSGAIPACPR